MNSQGIIFPKFNLNFISSKHVMTLQNKFIIEINLSVSIQTLEDDDLMRHNQKVSCNWEISLICGVFSFIVVKFEKVVSVVWIRTDKTIINEVKGQRRGDDSFVLLRVVLDVEDPSSQGKVVPCWMGDQQQKRQEQETFAHMIYYQIDILLYFINQPNNHFLILFSFSTIPWLVVMMIFSGWL